MRFILSFAFLICISLSAVAATDSLIIHGRIQNLNGRLYRQAPSITFSRNNILQPQSELSKQAPLAPDGSFRVSLPMLYGKEEIYLDYSGKAYTTFLGSPGSIEITFNGDSLATKNRLFYFAGENAEANNQNYTLVNEEAKRIRANSVLGTRFYDTFWAKSPAEAQNLATKRAELKLSALQAVAATSVVDPTLKNWANALAGDELLQNLFEYALTNQYALGKDLLDSLNRLAQSPLTAQRVTWASRFGSLADGQIDEKKATIPSRNNSLPVRRMAYLIRSNSSTLTASEKDRLDEIISKGTAEKVELDFLSNLYAKNEMLLNLLFSYERESRFYGDMFDSTAREFLKARFLPRNFHRYTYSQQLRLSQHIKSTLTIPQFRASLDEIVKMEVSDSVNIEKFISFKDVRAEPTEALPGYLISASNERGTTWLNRITDLYKGKTVYVVKWSFDDPKSRDDLAFMAALQAQLPTDVVFLFLHMPSEEVFVSGDLVKQYIVRHRLKGVHMFLSSGQTMDLLFKLNPIEPGTYAIIKPNGKFAQKTAPSPAELDKAIQAVLQARGK
ncbi:MAG TPA: hypothetical protein VGN64_22955 [Dyadobacter sp.]|jgi:hypothetical protein|nr:hypothetical protein [Dyadobacter sp.]